VFEFEFSVVAASDGDLGGEAEEVRAGEVRRSAISPRSAWWL
jgi:hypothetical protein